jgi:hypothetical protein
MIGGKVVIALISDKRYSYRVKREQMNALRRHIRSRSDSGSARSAERIADSGSARSAERIADSGSARSAERIADSGSARSAERIADSGSVRSTNANDICGSARRANANDICGSGHTSICAGLNILRSPTGRRICPNGQIYRNRPEQEGAWPWSRPWLEFRNEKRKEQ